MTKTILTQEILKELLHYDPDAGLFTWKARDRRWFETERIFNVWNARFSGEIAGTSMKGYCLVSLLGDRYLASRLAFMYMDGAFPPEDADHINGDQADDRWINLRAVTHQENIKNSAIPKNNTSGKIGVSWHKPLKKWRSQIRVDGKAIYLGVFFEFDDAVAARKKADIKYGFHANHGRPAKEIRTAL